MKIMYRLLASFSLLALLSACQPGSTSNEKPLHGKWSFNTLDGKYAELWTDDNALLTIREGTGRPYVFDYQQSGDTITLYQYGQKGEAAFEIDFFILQETSHDEITILQDTIHNTLRRISNKIDNIQDTEAYHNSALGEFEQRAKKAS